MSAPAPDARSAAPEPGPTQAPRTPPRAWLITFAVLAVVLVVSAIVLLLVVRPPSYEPVPIPSVSRT
ncbi:MAG TPA: hypothetical protein VEX66_08430 [Microlunatus sp.]|nr:hypothetical protein [Microlunatus sp.]